MNNMREELLTKEPVALMIKLCVPAVLGMLVIGLYSFVDAIYAGQMIGTNAMGAVSVAYPFTLINSGISTLIGMGSASVLSRAIGKKDSDIINKIMGNLLVLILILSAIVTVIGVVFAREVLLISGANGEILDLAVRYMRIVFIGSFFINFAQSANMIMRAEGRMKKAMIFMAIGAITNIILAPIIIILFNHQVEGAAVATLVSQIIQAVITMVYFIKESENVRFHGFKIEFDLLPEIFSIGFSAMLMQIMMFIQQVVIYKMASTYGGDSEIILIGAALRVLAFSFIPLWGMGQGLQPVVGTNYGAKHYDRVKKSINVFVAGATVLALCFWIPIQLFPKEILSLFIKDGSIVYEGINNFRLMYIIFPVLGFWIMSVTAFQSIGKGKNASVLVISRQIALIVPLIIILPMLMGIEGVWAAVPITDGIVFIVTGIMMIREYKGIGKAYQSKVEVEGKGSKKL
ncbi:MATE family efflux transporter [Clostridium beijerinckii]|uniref:Multidrug export protein MepA n=2 Tax=Clostridium beijerinckii TaxID=1520 RepID=A0AAX0AXP1_CLOBE|nr:MATE family efflux transporter [Clostridium beijerinckii]MBA8934423.1 putative MATE family efflux protein [Clostridium beijerinckii]NRT86934.1 putative MATE family efflux protein [Clostridium beijerinckii]NRU38610.1 putative MATE family efflux protein [Clostridium beijerinckii]NSA98111.1 putative MATE family efflux protein [Clostridium beijerinckii]NYC72366.1 putative MATE family efflux protein [Clostridium beijerinckii]